MGYIKKKGPWGGDHGPMGPGPTGPWAHESMARGTGPGPPWGPDPSVSKENPKEKQHHEKTTLWVPEKAFIGIRRCFGWVIKIWAHAANQVTINTQLGP